MLKSSINMVCRWPPSPLPLRYTDKRSSNTVSFGVSPFVISISSSAPITISFSIVSRHKQSLLAKYNGKGKLNQQPKKLNQQQKKVKRQRRKRKQGSGTENSEETPGAFLIDLREMPMNHVKDFVINDAFLGFAVQFAQIIEWFRSMCGMEGFSLNGIPSARRISSYPVFQINVTLMEFKTSLLFAKSDGYQQGYKYKGLWYLYTDCRYGFEGARSAESTGNYGSGFPPEIGPRALIEALETICMSSNEISRASASETLIVTFCESARNPAVQQHVLDAFEPICDSSDEFDENLNPNELIEVPGRSSPLFDAFVLTRAKFPINNFNSVCLKDPAAFSMKNGEKKYFCPLPYAIKKWQTLSKCWWLYVLSDGTFLSWEVLLKEEVIEELGIVNARSLRSLVGLVCHWDFDEILSYCKNIKSPLFTAEHYLRIERNVQLLKAEESRMRKGKWTCEPRISLRTCPPS